MKHGRLWQYNTSFVKLLAQAHDYREAWRLATVNRLDLNAIVDYRWPRFLQHASTFVAAVADDQPISDLLAALKVGNICAVGGLYQHAMRPPTTEVSNFLTARKATMPEKW